MLETFDDLSPKEKIKKGKIQLTRNTPFFGYLIHYLTPVQTEKLPTMGITQDSQLLYNPKFVDSLTEEELEGVLVHEVMHKALQTFERGEDRDKELTNIAHDLIINYIIHHQNGFKLPNRKENFEHKLPDEEDIPEELEEVWDNYKEKLEKESFDYILLPDSNGNYTLNDEIEIQNIDEKSFEAVYSEIKRKKEEQEDNEMKAPPGLDGLIINDNGDTKIVIGDEEYSVDENELPVDVGEGKEANTGEDWEDVVSRAASNSEMQGDLPGNIEGIIQASKDNSIDYKKFISQKIANLIPTDFTFTKKSNTGRGAGVRLPGMKKENKLSVIVALDTSGSVSDELLSEFVGEIQSIADSSQQVDLTIIQHDAEVQSISEYTNASSNDFDEVRVTGRGGTHHGPVFDVIDDKNLNTGETFLVCLTDGFSTVPDNVPLNDYQILWVVNNHEVEMDRLKHGNIIRTRDPNN